MDGRMDGDSYIFLVLDYINNIRIWIIFSLSHTLAITLTHIVTHFFLTLVLFLCPPPRCSTVSSRLAAYEVLVMLADSSIANLQLITRELLSMHHQSDPSLSKEFDVSPLHPLVFFFLLTNYTFKNSTTLTGHFIRSCSFMQLSNQTITWQHSV